MENSLWKYCTKEHCNEFLLSLGLTGDLCHTDERRLALLYGLSNHAEEHYTLRRIPKKSGGTRRILEPDYLLKTVQKQILRQILEQFSLPECATAYRKGVSISANAAPHTGKEKLLKLDIEDFFGNITYIDVYRHAFPGTLFPPPVRTLLTSLCCYDSVLPQGAPTSPCISNLVMKPFDGYMDGWCRSRGITYTRYSDDLTFSGSFDPDEVFRKTASFLNRLGFSVNRRKTRVIRRGARQEVTGLAVNDRVSVPKDYRRRLRQEWHYARRFGIPEHLRRTGALTGARSLRDKAEEERAVRNWILRFSGQVSHVLLADPKNTEFLRIREELKQIRIPEIEE